MSAYQYAPYIVDAEYNWKFLTVHL